jgi:preprotein translocase subunit Sec61beta
LDLQQQYRYKQPPHDNWISNSNTDKGEVVYICIAVGDPIIKGRLFLSVLLLEIQLSRGGCLYLYCCLRSNYQGEVVYICIAVGDPIIMGRLFISVYKQPPLDNWISNSNTDINNIPLIIGSPTVIQI